MINTYQSGGKTLALTAREREVAKLVARGYRDREIAQLLLITRPTASWHVRNILTKLALPRTQVGLWALQQGLIEPLPRHDSG